MNPSRSRLRPYLWTLGVLWLLPALLVGGAWLVLPKDLPPGQCEGIGFGCTLSPADTALLLGVLAGPTLATLGVVGVVVVAVVQAVRSKRLPRRSPGASIGARRPAREGQ